MVEAADEISVDIDAADASASKTDPPVVVDADLATKNKEAPVVTPEEGTEKLKKQLNEERQARLAAESRERAAAQAEADARNHAQTTELDLVKNAIASVTAENDNLESQYAGALAAQDWAAAAKVQRKMSENSARLSTLENGKTRLENAPKATPRAPTDPVEAYVSNIGTEFPRSRAWVRAHPDFVTDPLKQRQMVAAHELAIARGYKADTDKYFESVEKTLEIGAPTVVAPHVDDPDPLKEDPAASAAVATGGRNTAPPAAPVNRSGNGAAGRPNIVRLTADEVEMASNMGMTPEEYARNKVALKKEGRMS